MKLLALCLLLSACGAKGLDKPTPGFLYKGKFYGPSREARFQYPEGIVYRYEFDSLPAYLEEAAANFATVATQSGARYYIQENISWVEWDFTLRSYQGDSVGQRAYSHLVSTFHEHKEHGSK